MVCIDFKLDISAIEHDINKIKDKEIKTQIKKKIEKVKENPYIGEKKEYKLKDEYAVKVNNQRIVILYHLDEKNCIIIFDHIGPHDTVYKNTF
jgi:mRNA-degrading endonuclease RelE of RelBE toxin-antitoxin system